MKSEEAEKYIADLRPWTIHRPSARLTFAALAAFTGGTKSAGGMRSFISYSARRARLRCAHSGPKISQLGNAMAR